MNDISIDSLIENRNNAEKLFKSYRFKSNLLFAIFLLANFITLKYAIKTGNFIVNGQLNKFMLIWIVFILIFLYIDKFYFMEKLKQQKNIYHNCIKIIKEKHELANQAIEEKELLEKKINHTSSSKTKTRKI
jgi:hypothetical protein